MLSDGSENALVEDGAVSLDLRSYQHEMFERSLEGNTIVVVGSTRHLTAFSHADLDLDGDRKWENPIVYDLQTCVDKASLREASAIYRIKHALETMPNNKVGCVERYLSSPLAHLRS